MIIDNNPLTVPNCECPPRCAFLTYARCSEVDLMYLCRFHIHCVICFRVDMCWLSVALMIDDDDWLSCSHCCGIYRLGCTVSFVVHYHSWSFIIVSLFKCCRESFAWGAVGSWCSRTHLELEVLILSSWHSRWYSSNLAKKLMTLAGISGRGSGWMQKLKIG